MLNNLKKLNRIILWLAFSATLMTGQTRQNESDTARGGQGLVYINVVDGSARTDAKAEKFDLEGVEGCPLTLMLILNFAPTATLRYLAREESKEVSAHRDHQSRSVVVRDFV